MKIQINTDNNIEGGDEFTQQTQAVNGAADKLERLLDYQRGRLSDR